MSRGLAHVTLVGNLTRDPESRTAGTTTVTSFGVAVNLPEKRDGEWGERGHFFDVKVWGAQGDSAARYLTKGSQVAVNGHLEYETWEKDGNKRSAVRVVADQVIFLGGKGGGERATEDDHNDCPF